MQRPTTYDQRVTGENLVSHAGDPRVNARTIAYWRSRNVGVLPEPVRASGAGKTPVWHYPDGTLEQLNRLLELKSQRRTLDEICLALWFGDHLVRPELAIRSVQRILESWRTDIEKALAKIESRQSLSRDGAIAAAAAELARKRDARLPRSGRQPLAKREAGFALLLNLTFGDLPAGDIEDSASAFERIAGVDRGRTDRIGGSDPWLTGPAADVAGFASIGNIGRLIDTAHAMTVVDLAYARTIAGQLIGGLQVFSVLAEAQTGLENAGGFAQTRSLDLDDPSCQAYLLAFVCSAARSPLAEGIKTTLDAVAPMDDLMASFVEIAALDDAEVAARLDGLDAGDRSMIERVITRVRDEPSLA